MQHAAHLNSIPWIIVLLFVTEPTLSRISASIDQGHWFFPNVEEDRYGENKELGFGGYRHEVLNGLVVAYRCLGKIDYCNGSNNQTTRTELSDAKRHFTGRMQKILDPTRQREEFDKMHAAVTATPDGSPTLNGLSP